MSDHNNADGQAGQEVEPVAWRFRFPTGKKWHLAEFGPHELSRRELEWQPLYTHPAPACSAPDEALIEEIAEQSFKQWYEGEFNQVEATEWAIREYTRRAAGRDKG